MTPQPQQNPNELLSITREELERCCSQMSAAGYKVSANYVEASVLSRSHPATSQEAPETKQAYRNGLDEGFEIGKAQCETHHEDMKAEAAAQAREKALKPISAIYERFKHLDAILSKRDPDCPMMLCYVDIWEAVKESLRTGGEPR